MIRLIVFFVVLFAIALGGAWLADRPGSLVLDWQGYRLETSVMIAAVTLLGLLIAAVISWAVLRNVLGSPGAFARFWGRRRRERGYQALTRGLIAVGAGDSQAATKLARDAQKLLKNEPATKLLAAQAAQLSGRTEAARDGFTGMLEDGATQLLGLHGLYVEARRQGETEAARHYAEEAMRIAPSLPWAGKAVFEFQCAAKDWDRALETLERNASNKLIDKKLARRQRAVLMTARALELEDSDPERARKLAREAHNLAPDLVPAAVVASRLLSRANDYGRAAKILEAAWKKEPHPEIAEAYIHIRPGDSARDRLKRVQALTQMRAHHPEGMLALARVAIDTNDWATARDALTKVLRSTPTQNACLLMADVEEGEHGDHGRVREWLSRAVHAPRDPVWIADGVVSEHWAPLSPVTGRLDAFEWKVPVAGLAAPKGAVIDEELLAPRAPVAVATAPAAIAAETAKPGEPAAETVIEDVEVAEEMSDEPATVAATPVAREPSAAEPVAPPATPEAPAEAAKPAIAPAEMAAPTTTDMAAPEAQAVPESTASASIDADEADSADADDGPKLVTFPLGHAPDDPGTSGDDDDAESSGRFKLFS